MTTLAHITAAVAHDYGLSVGALLSRDRKQPAAGARQVAMFLARTMTPLSFAQIAFGLRRLDHTTAVYGCAATRRRIEADRDFGERVARIRAGVGA